MKLRDVFTAAFLLFSLIGFVASNHHDRLNKIEQQQSAAVTK